MAATIQLNVLFSASVKAGKGKKKKKKNCRISEKV